MANDRKASKIATADCETDPFKYGRVPKPFLWGYFDGENFEHFADTESFVDHIKELDVIIYMHNGGKFDFHFLYDWFNEGKITLINSRIVEIKIGNATLRDSYSIMPVPLSAYEKTKIEYWKFEENCRHEYIDEIISYLKDDCVYLYDMVSVYIKNVGRKITLASNALAFSKKIEIDVGRTNKHFDDIFRKFYAGGRCSAFQIGEFKNINLTDIKSAYPYAMTFDHATGDNYRVTDIIPADRKRGETMFFEIECFSHAAFWERSKDGLNFPIKHGVFFVTGWELYTALEFNLCENVKVIRAYEFYDTINFKSYIDHWFAVKEKAELEGDKINRTLAKLLLNSLYGKLAQNPENFYEYQIKAKDTPLETGWELHAEQATWELHAKPKNLDMREKMGDNYDFVYQFYNVACAASITGFVRASILKAISRVGIDRVIYCDTDSLFFSGHDNLSIPNPGLGFFGLDGKAKELFVAGKKLYAARLQDGKEKIASKGVKLSFDEIVSLVKGNIVEWKSDAPTFSIEKPVGFVKRKVRRK